MESLEKVNESLNSYQEKAAKLDEAIKNSKCKKEDLPVEEIKTMKKDLEDLKAIIIAQREAFISQLKMQKAALSAATKK